MREKPKNKERLYHIIEAIDNILKFVWATIKTELLPLKNKKSGLNSTRFFFAFQ